MTLPTWWLVLSAVFFVMNILLFGALIFACLKLVQVVQGVQPQVKDLSDKVHALIDKVDALAASVRENVESVGARTKGIVGSVELIAQSASRQFERFSPFIVGATTAMRLIKALNEMRHGRSAAEATNKKTLEQRPAKVDKPKRKKRFGIL